MMVSITQGTPGNLSVSWYRDSSPVTSVSSLQGRVTVQSATGSLIINPVKVGSLSLSSSSSIIIIITVQAEDAGTYVCELTNGIGRPQRATAHLEVTCKCATYLSIYPH